MATELDSIEQQIRVDIEELRDRFPQTQDMYREVCALLFFRYGITPTANKLYQFVRKGSMSAPAEALAKFWSDLREKSRVRVEHPDLPDALSVTAGDLVATLWAQAQVAAQESLSAFRAQAEGSVLNLKAAIEASEANRSTALKERDNLQRLLEEGADRALHLERSLAAERAEKEAISGQLNEANRQQAAREAVLSDAHKNLASELEKLRQALQKSEERYEAAEKRALLEIERERLAGVKLQKDLVQLRHHNSETTEQHRVHLAQLQRELGKARQNLGVAEGALREMRLINQQQLDQLEFLRSSESERVAKISLLQREIEDWLAKVAELKLEIDRLREAGITQPKKPGARKKSQKPPVEIQPR